MNMVTSKKLVYDLDRHDFQTLLTIWGEKPYRVDQIWQGLYKKYWLSPNEFTIFSLKIQGLLTHTFRFDFLAPENRLISSDAFTEKILFRLHDGLAIETVLMQYKDRYTVCISTQVGCAMGCVFCATGQMGYQRNLSSGEIIGQVLYYANQLSKKTRKLTNIVIMGMGEPFLNYEATMMAIDRLNDHDGFNFGERRFTISTVGIVPRILKFASEKRQINLAISLHAADDDLRSRLIPLNTRYPIDLLLDACSEYVSLTNRRISFEWAMIRDVNDSPQQAHLLASKIHNLLCHVNIIPLNSTNLYRGKSSDSGRARIFKNILEAAGIQCTIRLRRGVDIHAGCGQLAINQDLL
jgi:23S rRNA (adenine2503-C2)-methyltransferase